MIEEIQLISDIQFYDLITQGVKIGFILVFSVGLFSLGIMYSLKLFSKS